VIDFLVAKISGFGKEREPALALLTQIDPSFIRRKLPDMLQPVINMCTDTSKKVRCVCTRPRRGDGVRGCGSMC